MASRASSLRTIEAVIGLGSRLSGCTERLVASGVAAALILSCMIFAATSSIAADSFTVTLDAPVHGKFELKPALPTGGKYPAGSVITVTTQPDPGYTLDAGYYSVP